ncbi:amino acid ABC transporter permease [Shinella oryzae]|uniref:Amino acid ABC transporter permease n=1 Tax=Shinella oryzae TaxID=2871820 RepID=A0ABY9K8A0_9HYPH|nr:amino acid ABC transporter permease [Shinella oryzae]WLS04810.1 amino acid ABC transporter permease [Shinella oryzae]
MTYQFDFGVLLPYWPQFLHACLLTLWLAATAVVCGFVIGIATVLARRSGMAVLRVVALSYIEVIRNTPFLVQVFFIFFGLPTIGISFTPWTAAFIALSLNCGAFSAEIIRGGVDSIPRGQFEAGAALGLTPLQVFRYIILKPALRIIYPALSGQFILALLTTSIVSSISAEELTSTAQLIDSDLFRSFEIYIVATFLYFALSMIFSFIFKGIDRAFFSYPIK